jgi:hypothetical protein
MPMIQYVPKKFNAQHQEIVRQANEIIERYAAQGYDLTLRQLYYQFVAGDLFPESWRSAATGSTNNEQSYKKLGSILSDARRAGLVDWNRIVDRTRIMREPPTWPGPESIVRACAAQFNVDLWDGQPSRVEVWIEKDALVGVLEVACREWQCPYFSCRGYTSDSAVWVAARRMMDTANGGQKVLILHLGDHDPSGIDMTRDIRERVELFAGKAHLDIEVKRIALNMNQVEEYNPPPNPAKETDSRYAEYRERFGEESWELDALNPETLTELIADEMRAVIEQEAWDAAVARRDEGRRLLGEVARRWNTLTQGL